MTLQEILDVLNQARHTYDISSHPDDRWRVAQNDMLDTLADDFRRECE